jgi:hypothetical protein
MEEHRKQILCYYCDEKYAPGHKCREQKLFQIDASTSSSYDNIPSDEVSNKEASYPGDPIKDLVFMPMEYMDLVIWFHSLSSI